MEHAEPNPWDRRPSEPPECYARFMVYRNLGPCRTILGAYRDYLRTFKNAQKRNDPQLVPGHWGEDSAAWDWSDRASAWDIHNLSAYGDELGVLWVGILTVAARKCAEKLAQPGCRPKDFMQALAVVDKLAQYLSPDAVKSLQPAAGTGRPKPKDRAAVE